MDEVGLRMLALAIAGVGTAAVSAWLHINDKDGDGWALMAFFLIIASCSQY
ncbi:MAG: hypothetical protein ABW134_11875 [Candidatus Thiodiazotropha endolucinida]